METLQGQAIDRLVAVARTYLVRARIAKQKAVIVMETPNYTHSDAEVGLVALSYRQDAYRFRVKVRETLIAVDLWNSKRYMNGQTYLGLSHTLNGRNFRNWKEYETEYEFEMLYQGMDPC